VVSGVFHGERQGLVSNPVSRRRSGTAAGADQAASGRQVLIWAGAVRVGRGHRGITERG